MSSSTQNRHRKNRQSAMAYIQYWSEFLAFLFAVAVIRRIPLRFALSLGAFFGSFCFHILKIRRKLVLGNLQIAFPDKTFIWRKDIALKHYRNAGMTIIELMRLPDIARLPDEQFLQRIELQGAEHLLQAGWGERPYIACTAHTGNWELDGIYAGRNNMQFSALVKRIHNPLLDRWINNARQSSGTQIIYLKELKRVYRHVRDSRGGICFLNDQDARRQGEFIDFFGRPASTFAGPAFFSLKFNIPLIPIFQYRCEENPVQHVITVQQPINPPDNLSQKEQIRHMLVEFNKRLEMFIRERPDQYFWMHNRWKTQPKIQLKSVNNE